MLKRLLATIALAVSLGACALTVDQVDIAYAPQASSPVVGASGVKVDVNVNDARTSYRDRISSKKNGYGMEMAAIVSRQSVPKVVSDAIETELKARGFTMGKGNTSVLVDINKFYNDFKLGFLQGKAVGEVSLNVQVLNGAGKYVFAKSFVGEYTVDQVMMMGGDNAKMGIEGALKTALAKMMADDFFLQSLVEASRAATASGKPVS
jgi:uncharacterized lipoprotein